MLAFAIFSTFGMAFVLPFFLSKRCVPGWALALLPLALTAYFIRLLPAAMTGEPATFFLQWADAFGLTLSFRADGLSLLFALLISGIGTLVTMYGGEYLKKHKSLNRFYVWLFIFMGAMLGVAFADNLLLLFVFWELTSLSSFMLIGFEHERESARSAALQALLVTGAGGLAMLAGMLLLGQAGGGFELSRLILSADEIQASPLYLPALILILLGAFTKSAQFPFHFWLPNAMEAPTPISAYLHSATMVKAGVYLLARLFPVLGGTELWLYLVGGTGAATMIVSAYLAFLQTDLKKLLAYSTLSALGTLTLLVGIGSSLALKSAMVLLLAHGLYKGALFLVAGILDHETGTRDVTQLGGLFRELPFTAFAAGAAALSMAGLPPLFGFISKELTYEAGLEFGWLVTAVIVFMGLANVFVAGLTGVKAFIGAKLQTPKHAHEAPWTMWTAPALLAVLSLLFGLAPSLLSNSLIAPAVSAAAGESVKVKLALWHGINPAFILSLLTVIAGAGLYVIANPLRAALNQIRWGWGPARLYQFSLDGMLALARWQTGKLQTGYLRDYLLFIILTVTAGGAWAFSRYTFASFPLQFYDIQFYEIIPAILILAGAAYGTMTKSRLGAVASLGAVGYGVALVYLIFSAPDLAMTQFAIESLTVILFVLVFYHLPKFQEFSPKGIRFRDAVIALAAGSLMTLLSLAATNTQFFEEETISRHFVENALLAHGRNVVNVILVDFRALDTLGEITVLGVAAVGVFALLKFRKGKGEGS